MLKKKKKAYVVRENLKKKQREERLQLLGKASVPRLKSRCEQQFIYRNSSLEVGGQGVHRLHLTEPTTQVIEIVV